jgi:hypothetical protein
MGVSVTRFRFLVIAQIVLGFLAPAPPAAAGLAGPGEAPNHNPFGVMLGVFQDNKAAIVGDLRVAYYRTDPTITLTTWD